MREKNAICPYAVYDRQRLKLSMQVQVGLNQPDPWGE